MGRHVSLEPKRLAAEGHAQALRHAGDAVGRSAWLLAMLRRDIAEDPRARGLRRLELHCMLADLERRQARLSAAYRNMAATPARRKAGELKAFVLAYDEFLAAVGATRMECYEDGDAQRRRILSSRHAVSRQGSAVARFGSCRYGLDPA